jgi:uncharacterized RDD family membrane protein YckC
VLLHLTQISGNLRRWNISLSTMPILHRIVVVGLFLTLIVCFYLPGNQIGYGYHRIDDKVDVSAGSHPALIVWAVLAACFYVLLLRKSPRAEAVGPASMTRRALSFLIDFLVFVMAVSSVTALIPLAVEAHRVGHFEWSFARDFEVPTDSINTPLTFLFLIALFLYVAYPLTKGKQTIGDYTMRIKVLPPFGVEGKFTWREAVKRTWYSLMGACLWPYTLLEKVDRNGQTWYDRKTNCTVVLVDYKRADADFAP